MSERVLVSGRGEEPVVEGDRQRLDPGPDTWTDVFFFACGIGLCGLFPAKGNARLRGTRVSIIYRVAGSSSEGESGISSSRINEHRGKNVGVKREMDT